MELTIERSPTLFPLVYTYISGHMKVNSHYIVAMIFDHTITLIVFNVISLINIHSQHCSNNAGSTTTRCAI